MEDFWCGALVTIHKKAADFGKSRQLCNYVNCYKLGDCRQLCKSYRFILEAIKGSIVVGRNKRNTVFAVLHAVNTLHVVADSPAFYANICRFVKHTLAVTELGNKLVSKNQAVYVDNFRGYFVRSFGHFRDGQNVVRYFSFHTYGKPFHQYTEMR